ncbi:MAG: ATP-dependent DNA ligase, partial [Thermoplasmata archaeon]|nr:ATP-dependent DNA ligase [Thermoplasmata archaeon]
IDKVTYLTQGKVYPDFVPYELGLAEKMVIKAMASASGLKEGEVESIWKGKGDMGLVAEEAIGRKTQTTLMGMTELTVEKVYENLEKITKASGPKSQDIKMRYFADLLHNSKPVEARYITRSVMGKMRLGVADMTMIDALAIAFAEKEHRDEIERAYNVCSDLGLVAKTLAEGGLKEVKKIHLKMGVPIRAMLAERLSKLEDILEKTDGKAAFEYKYDGLRLQAHVTKDKVELFSRRLEDMTEQFPEFKDVLKDGLKGKEAIVEGECVPVDINTGAFLPFQIVSHRRGRKYGLREAQEEYPVHLILFDCLYLDGKDLTNEPYEKRRKQLKKAIKSSDTIMYSEVLVTDDPEKAERFFHKSIEDGSEGLIAKHLQSVYVAGSRGWNWIKYKKDYKSEMRDTVDLVVVGGFAGRGRRAGTYGALLMAGYDEDEDRFKTICKLGSGFDDEMLVELLSRLDEYKIEKVHEKVDSRMKADFWFEPQVVLEVLGAEITISPSHTAALDVKKKDAGLAIRFPRFTGTWRGDKGPREATTVRELVGMYESQLKKLE